MYKLLNLAWLVMLALGFRGKRLLFPFSRFMSWAAARMATESLIAKDIACMDFDGSGSNRRSRTVSLVKLFRS